jgi:hypothetical protein
MLSKRYYILYRARESENVKTVSAFNLLRTTSLRFMGEWRYSTTILELGTRWK